MNLPNPFPGVVAKLATPNQLSTPMPEKYKFKKAGKNGTLITVVLDESGSMNSCRDTTIAGFNEFVQGQRNTESTAGIGYMTLIKFDAPKIKTVFNNRTLDEVPELNKLNYSPNGGTNLLDAIGDAIESVNTVLKGRKKSDRPGVIVTIITDGAENSSVRYTNNDIKEMVAAAEAADWTFVFLGANIDAFAVGSTFGMHASNSINYDTANMTATMSAVSESTYRMRSAKIAGTGTAEIYNNGIFTSVELKNMKE
jgi:hypothetical protein